MGNTGAICSVKNDLGEAAEVQSYSGADPFFWSPHASHTLAEGEEKTFAAAFEAQGLHIVCNGRWSWVKSGSCIRLSWLAEQGKKLDNSLTAACRTPSSMLTETETAESSQGSPSPCRSADTGTFKPKDDGVKMQLQALQARCEALEAELAKARCGKADGSEKEVAMLKRLNRELMKDNEVLAKELRGYQKGQAPTGSPRESYDIGTPRPELRSVASPGAQDVDATAHVGAASGDRGATHDTGADWYYE